MPRYYHNQMLFSEIYLEEITQQEKNPDVLASLDTLRQYREYADDSHLARWKQSFVNEALAVLGFAAKEASAHQTNLFPMGGAEKVLTVCVTAPPEADLDTTLIGANWAEKTIRCLRDENLPWGLLTNGKQWRIYHRDEAQPYETYLSIDLESILEDRAEDAYQIFHQFLQVKNFTTDEDGNCAFDVFKQESLDKIDYIEHELANSLKPREEGGQGVLSDLCMGYVEYMRNTNSELALDEETTRRKIYHGAMLYMFRLLFLFYADARDLLSDDNHQLLVSASSACRRRDDPAWQRHDVFDLWRQLQQIFVDIDQTYNGGLFSPQESEFTLFIEDTPIADCYLAPVIYNLSTYHEKDKTEKAISYRDMGVRHLGTLYEGLLEHKLYITQEDTEVKVAKGKVQYIPASKGGKLVVGRYLSAGAVYFAGDPSERKSSGSYYTPEDVVDYIVCNTVGEKLSSLQEAFLTQEQANLDAYNLAVNEQERTALAALLEENALTFVREQVLGLSVLDPAMGSGHFLVNAANHIANLITALLNGLPITGSANTGTAYWRRRVVENCLYGVDLNPLAVELAKLSLWILSMAKDQPLSFLNHHLKCGNSLVGARLEEIGRHPLSERKKETHQLSLFAQDDDFKAAVEAVVENAKRIAGRESATLDDVQAKKAWLEEIDRRLAGYKAICDVHTALYFGLQLDEMQYNRLVTDRDFALAQVLNTPNFYFHWELEFPEICLSKGGFGCIVCNPPYDTIREDDYYKKEEAAGCGNLFGHFITKAVSINQTSGAIGFIVPLSFSCGTSYEQVRQIIYQRYHSLFTSHYSKRPNMLFEGVQQRITIFIARKKEYSNGCHVHSSRLWRWKKSDQAYVVRNPELSYVDCLKVGVIPKVGSPIGANIYKKVKNSSQMKHVLSESSESEKHEAHYHSVAMYWIKAYNFIPYFKRESDSQPARSTKLKTVFFSNEFDKNLFLLFLNSSLFYLWWIAQGDEFDVRVSEVDEFGISGYEDFKKNTQQVRLLVQELMDDYQKHSVIKSTSLGGSKAYYQEFYPRRSRYIINRIDDFIAPIYGLTPEENEFLKNFDIEWRTD